MKKRFITFWDALTSFTDYLVSNLSLFILFGLLVFIIFKVLEFPF